MTTYRCFVPLNYVTLGGMNILGKTCSHKIFNRLTKQPFYLLDILYRKTCLKSEVPLLSLYIDLCKQFFSTVVSITCTLNNQ